MTARLLIVALAILTTPLAAQNAGLRIVVIEGEDAVNIIQQNTAVRPLVEVRDRNDLPVPGVLVTFSIEGGKAASFGGASTLTVATNAAGQAAVTGLTPSAAGAFQIQVQAAFQGLVATATIAQTNVLTAAQAAAQAAGGAAGSGSTSSAGGGASGGSAGSASGAAGAGGGLSTTTLVVAGAAVAGGAVAAQQISEKAGDAEVQFTGSFSGSITGSIISQGGKESCTFRRAVSASANIKFEQFSDSAVRGRFQFEGSDTVAASTCAAPPALATFIGHVDLTGSPARFSGRNTFPHSQPSGGSVQGENIYTFDGAVSGDVVTGTFTYEQKSFSPGDGGGSVQMIASGTFAVTLRKS